MKTHALLLSLSLAAIGASPAQAEIFRANAVANAALLGGIAGAFMGGHNHDRWGQGAVIGAAAGALLGRAVEPQRPVVYAPAVPVYAATPACLQPGAASQVIYVQAQPRVIFIQQPAQVVYVSSPPAPVIVVAAQPRHPYHRGGEIVYLAPGFGRR